MRWKFFKILQCGAKIGWIILLFILFLELKTEEPFAQIVPLSTNIEQILETPENNLLYGYVDFRRLDSSPHLQPDQPQGAKTDHQKRERLAGSHLVAAENGLP